LRVTRRRGDRIAEAVWIAVLAFTWAIARPASIQSQQPDSTRVRVDSSARSATRPAADSDTTRARRRKGRRPLPPGRVVVKPPISPGRAALYSLLVPGLGQAKLDNPYTGAFFFTIEAISIAQVRQAIIDRNYNAHHTSDSVVSSYQTDGVTGTPLSDSSGRPVPTGYVYNRYASSTTSDRLAARRLHVEDWVAALIFNHLISGADAFVSAELWDLPRHVTAFRTDDGRMGVGLSFSVR
jgi:hypothetical protein